MWLKINGITFKKYFDECWDLHSALTDHLEENCIPIMQNCDFSSFYKLCQYGKRYIVDLEHQQKQNTTKKNQKRKKRSFKLNYSKKKMTKEKKTN